MLGRDGLRRWWSLPIAVVALMAVHVAVLSSHRFAVPVLPVVFVLVSGPLAAAFARVAPILRTPAVAVSAVVLAAILVTDAVPIVAAQIARHAADLDGQAADNVVDPVSQTRVRFADAGRKERPIVLLTDEYLPRGPMRVEIGMRLASANPPAGTVARIALIELDGHVACAREVASDILSNGRFETVALSCRVSKDTPATLAVFTLGIVDLAVDTVRLVWTPLPARAE